MSNSTNGKSLLAQIGDYGQSVWYDNISRGLISSGGIQKLIDEGIVGMTSNPAIFEKAMSEGSDYDEAFEELVSEGKDVNAIFQALSVDDIGHAADILRPVYQRTNGLDGYISIEVSPELAHDSEGTLKEARTLLGLLNRPNIMIKIPATPEGIPAIRQMTAEGANVNITLIFGMAQYEDVMEAYISGLEDRLKMSRPVDHIHSVASFFVSRVDTLIDKRLDEIAKSDPAKAEEAKALLGKAAIANARIAYQNFEQKFSGPRWQALKAHGANLQRPLWASTSTKNPAYPDTIYADALIGPNTVDTMPQVTVDAMRDHGHPADRIKEDLPQQHDYIKRLAAIGIDIEAVAAELQTQGVKLFADAFDKLRQSLSTKREAIIARQQGDDAKADHKEAVASDEAAAAKDSYTAANK